MSDLPASQLSLSYNVERLQSLVGESPLHDDLGAVAAAIRDEPPAHSERLARIVRDFDLTAFELDIVVLVGLPEEHESISQLARHLHALGEPAMSFGIIANALGLDWTGRSHLRSALESGPLRNAALVVGAVDLPLPERKLHLPAGLWPTIRGSNGWPDELQPAPIVPHADPSADQIAPILTGGDSDIVVVAGARDRSVAELSGLVASILDQAGIRWVGIPAPSLDVHRSRLWAAHCVARGVVPIVVGDGAEDLLTTFPSRVITCLPTNGRLPDDARTMSRVEVGARDIAESLRLWQGLAPELNGQADRVAGLLRVDHVHAMRAINDSRSAAPDDLLDARAIVEAVRTRSGSHLPPSARLVKPASTIAQLVLPPKERQQIEAVLDRLQQQVAVLQGWGFDGVSGRRGVRLLLSGPPGTGKTLTVEALAAELGLDLMVVDLSALVSKWLGETEKNLAEVFDAAEQQQAVLFFDEADAIFGRRTDAGDAHARWANLETAYLLGRIEAFEGLVALATNLRSNIDEAFFRRLDIVVQLTEPGHQERVELWRRHMPAQADFGSDVCVEQLASLYPITGGQIRNATLTAAFAAAAEGIPIGQRTLVEAVKTEYEKSGRSFPGAPPNLNTLQLATGKHRMPARRGLQPTGTVTVRKTKERT